MAGYLEEYGAGEVKRGKIIKRITLAAVALIVILGALYFTFRNYREVRQAERFFSLLRVKDYAAAYSLWGCTASSPCSGYSMDRFLEDWGPKSQHADLSQLKITKTRGCSDGVIVIASFGKGQDEDLWVARSSLDLGFAPWPVCNPRGSQVLGASQPTMTK